MVLSAFKWKLKIQIFRLKSSILAISKFNIGAIKNTNLRVSVCIKWFLRSDKHDHFTAN